MNTPAPTMQVTLRLPEEVYRRIEHAARHEHRQLDEFLSTLVADGLEAHATTRELFEKASVQYRARLDTDSKRSQSSDEVLQELRNLREEVAGELYP